jgi:NitT/TauT family transport system substrate-binding protein
MKRRTVVITLFFFLLCLIAAFAEPNKKINISMLKGPTGVSGAWMMSELGRTSPHEFTFITVASADMVVAKLLSGEIEVGVLPVNIAAKLYNSGVPLQVLAIVGNSMVKFLTLDSSIKSLDDLKGKTIYIAGQKATPDYVFQYLCVQRGLAAHKDYTPLYNLAYPEIAAGIAAGRIEYAVLPEPFATQAILKNASIKIPFDITDEWTKVTGQNDFPMSALIAKKELIEDSPDLIKILMDSYRASIKKALEDPTATGMLAGSLDLGISAQTASSAIPVSNFIFIESQEAIPSIEALLRVFLSFDSTSIGGVLPNRSFYAKIR